MADTESLENLCHDEQLLVSRSVADLQREFHGTFDDETIEHVVVDSFQRLAARARATTFLAVLSERFARERLTALAHVDGAEPGRPGVLFLCVHNAGRSQMAAGWLRTLAGDRVAVYTGGSEPSSALNPIAIEAMAEVDIDITDEFPKPWTDEVVRAVDVVITMGCGDACPYIPGKRYVDWDLDDPEGQSLDVVRRVRDAIRTEVEGLMAELGVSQRG